MWTGMAQSVNWRITCSATGVVFPTGARCWEHGNEPSGSEKAGFFLTVWAIISFSTRILQHAVGENIQLRWRNCSLCSLLALRITVFKHADCHCVSCSGPSPIIWINLTTTVGRGRFHPHLTTDRSGRAVGTPAPCSGDPGFKSLPGDQLAWLRFL